MTISQEATAPEQTTGGAPAGASGAAAGMAGALSALLALGVTELVAGVVDAVPSLLVSVGDAVIDLAPPPVKDLAIAVFGTADKLALQVGTVILAAAAGAALGRAAARRSAVGEVGFAVFAALGVAATTAAPQASAVGGAVAAVLGAAAGIAALRLLLAAAPPGRAAAGTGRLRPTGPETAQADGARRRFLGAALAVGGAAVTSGVVGRRLAGPGVAAGQRASVTLPVGSAQPTPPADTTVPVDGVPPLFTPNDDFYRIDTALRIPRVDLSTWRLGIAGLVGSELSLSYDDLLAEADLVADVTLACVSNEVGGGLVGNARWVGVPLARLLDRAGVRPEGRQVVGRSLDGFTAGFPTALALDGREAMVAVGMNGEPLPLRHGFPARLVVPGLYGYVSATKWLESITLEPEGFDGYWIPRGWAKDGPIKTQSRIDVPAHRAQVTPGPVAVAGVAWAPTRGIEAVEVRVDEGRWQPARLADALDVDTWRQWIYEWSAEPGSHQLQVRATDGEGRTQTGERQPPAPDGATGWHTISVDVAQA